MVLYTAKRFGAEGMNIYASTAIPVCRQSLSAVALLTPHACPACPACT
jgi:hypothetical protein